MSKGIDPVARQIVFPYPTKELNTWGVIDQICNLLTQIEPCMLTEKRTDE